MRRIYFPVFTKNSAPRDLCTKIDEVRWTSPSSKAEIQLWKRL